MKKALSVIVLLVVFFSCRKQEEYLPPDFNYKIEPVQITEDVEVGAFYSNYSAADWAKKFTNTPLNGEYSALDPQIMESHRKWADEGGVNFFIFNWNGASAGDPLLNSFIGGRNSAVRMVINYNMSHLKATNSSPLEGDKLNTMIEEFRELADQHFGKDYYYRLDGRPVVMISPLNLSGSAASSIDYQAVIPAVKAAMAESGIDLYIIGEITQGWLPPVRYANAIKAMDAVELSNWATDTYDRAVFFNSFSDMNWKNWTDSTRKWNVDFVPCILPAYNDKVMTPASKMINLGSEPNFFVDYCNVAKRNMSEKRLVIVNSWNNFQLGTSVEPTEEYGKKYLEILRDQFKVK